MKAPELLTCPFCGSNDVDNKRADARYHCYRCGADGPQIPYAPDDKAWTWSTRTAQPDPRDEVIATLVDALHAIELWDAARGYPISTRHRDTMRAALASAKAVQP